VLSFEGPMAVRLGYDAKLLALVCQRFAKRVMQALRHQTKREHGLHRVQGLHSGVLVVVQRFRSDLGLFVHLHALATDGCFEVVGDDDGRFLPVEQLSDTQLHDDEPKQLALFLPRNEHEFAAITSLCATSSCTTDHQRGCPG
jgi:hypothetical protein